VLERGELQRWFPDDKLLVVPESVLPAQLSHGPTRRLLSEVGVPESFLEVMELDFHLVERVRRVGDIYRKYDEEPPDGTGDLIYLGFAGQVFLAIDGPTGRVLQVAREFGSRLLASSLESFLRVLGVVSGEVLRYQRARRASRRFRFGWLRGYDDPVQFAERLNAIALRRLRRQDPGALPAAEPAWRSLLADIAANAS
jgi:hypothetical protein